MIEGGGGAVGQDSGERASIVGCRGDAFVGAKPLRCAGDISHGLAVQTVIVQNALIGNDQPLSRANRRCGGQEVEREITIGLTPEGNVKVRAFDKRCRDGRRTIGLEDLRRKSVRRRVTDAGVRTVRKLVEERCIPSISAARVLHIQREGCRRTKGHRRGTCFFDHHRIGADDRHITRGTCRADPLA